MPIIKIIDARESECYTKIIFSDAEDAHSAGGMLDEFSVFCAQNGLVTTLYDEKGAINFDQKSMKCFEFERVIGFTHWEKSSLEKALYEVWDACVPVEEFGRAIVRATMHFSEKIGEIDPISLGYVTILEVAGLFELVPYFKRVEGDLKIDIDVEAGSRIMNSVPKEKQKGPWNSIYYSPVLWRNGVSPGKRDQMLWEKNERHLQIGSAPSFPIKPIQKPISVANAKASQLTGSENMKVKIFHGEQSLSATEQTIQSWLNRNPRIQIHGVSQSLAGSNGSTGGQSIIVTVFYSE